MSNSNERRFIVPGLSSSGDTLLRFREPSETVPDVLFGRIRDGTYDKPFLVEDLEFRAMCFALDGSTQSEMRLDDPEALVSAYTRKMMGFLLFRSRPRRILMIGLGGGSLVKYCHRHLPTTHITAVEIDPEVIALRKHFHVPPDDSRLQVVNEDGARHVAAMAQADRHTDVMLVDAYDRRGIANAVVEHAFLENARRILSPCGVFVMNLAEDTGVCDRYIETIRSVFGDPVIAVAMEGSGNVVVFAGSALRDRRRLMTASLKSHRIQGRLGLHFPTLLRRTTEYQKRLRLQGERGGTRR
jgi:spermidine synthase